MDAYRHFNPVQGPAPLPILNRSKILIDPTGALYAAWHEMYFAAHYSKEN